MPLDRDDIKYGVGENFDHERYFLDRFRNSILQEKWDNIDAGCICYDNYYTWQQQYDAVTLECPIHKRPKKEKVKKDKKYVFITIQDFQRRLSDIECLQSFLTKIAYLYDEGEWIIESGKVKDSNKYNVHIHMLVKIRNSKKHLNQLNIAWMKYFNTSLKDKDYYKMCQHRDCKAMPSYEDWVAEKREYFTNNAEGKGDHVNTEDLGLRGSWAP